MSCATMSPCGKLFHNLMQQLKVITQAGLCQEALVGILENLKTRWTRG